MKSVGPNHIAGQVVGMIRGALIGYPLGKAIGEGEPNWGIAGIGVASIAVSIPISSKFNNNAKKAISIYYNSLKETSCWDTKESNFSANDHSVGLIFKF